MSEHDEQVALFEWAAFAASKHPELELLYAIPNGGERSKATAGKLKAAGVKAGVPDVCLPVPRGGYGACYIELKRPSQPGRPRGSETARQRTWRLALLQAGNDSQVCTGWTQARDALLLYLALPAQPAVGDSCEAECFG